MGRSPAALTVDHPSRSERVAETARQGVEPLIVEVDVGASERAGNNRPASFVAGPVKHVAEANHPTTAELVVATGSAAAAKPEPFEDTLPPGKFTLASPNAPPTGRCNIRSK